MRNRWSYEDNIKINLVGAISDEDVNFIQRTPSMAQCARFCVAE
jgi:hypothetical protein